MYRSTAIDNGSSDRLGQATERVPRSVRRCGAAGLPNGRRRSELEHDVDALALVGRGNQRREKLGEFGRHGFPSVARIEQPSSSTRVLGLGMKSCEQVLETFEGTAPCNDRTSLGEFEAEGRLENLALLLAAHPVRLQYG